MLLGVVVKTQPPNFDLFTSNNGDPFYKIFG